MQMSLYVKLLMFYDHKYMRQLLQVNVLSSFNHLVPNRCSHIYLIPKETTHFCFSISNVNVNVFLSKFRMSSMCLLEYTAHSCQVDLTQDVLNISTHCRF